MGEEGKRDKGENEREKEKLKKGKRKRKRKKEKKKWHGKKKEWKRKIEMLQPYTCLKLPILERVPTFTTTTTTRWF